MNRISEKQQATSPLAFCVVLALLIMLPAITYSNSFQAPFVFDDIENIVENNSMHMTTLSVKSLQRAAFEGVIPNRLVPNLSYGLNYYFGGHNVWGYHLVNLVVHIMTALVLYGLFVTTLTLPRLGFSLRRATEISLISALVWAVHPLQTNAVTYLVQRMTSMVALFYLSSLLFYVRGRLEERVEVKRYGYWVLAFFCGIIALVCKENSVMLPLIIVAYEFYFLKEQEWKMFSGKGPVILGGVILSILVISYTYLGGISLLGILDGYTYRDFTLVERLLTESRIVIHYISLILLPLPGRLNLNYDLVVSSSIISPPVTMLAISAIIFFIGLTFYLFRRNRLLSFGLLWFFVNLLIESTIIPLELVFEHRLYLPSTMLILAVVVLLGDLWGKRQQVLHLFWVTVIITLCLFAWQRNEVWSTEIGLWRDVIAKSPSLSRVYSYLGRAYNNEERYQEAYDLFQEAAGQEFDDVNIYNNWGLAAFNLGKTAKAVELLEQAIRLDSNHSESHYNLGVVYGVLGRDEEARHHMRLGMMLQ